MARRGKRKARRPAGAAWPREMLDYLAARGVDEGCAEVAGLEPLSVEATREIAGRSAYGRSSFRVPHRDLDGRELDLDALNFAGQEAAGFKPSREQRKPPKIWQSPGVSPALYLPPPPPGAPRSWREVANDPGEAVIITEGPVKAICASRRGLRTVAVAGVENFHEGGDPDRLVAGLDDFTWRGRQVDVTFDSDAAANPNVRAAEEKLKAALERRGAFVVVVRLPPGPDGGKQGLDDYLVREGADGYRRLRASYPSLPDALDDGGGLLDAKFPPLRFAVEPYLPRTEVVEIHGPHGQFKSLIMLNACLSVATGQPWGGAAAQQGRAVFVSLEDRAATLQRRVRAWLGRKRKFDGGGEGPDPAKLEAAVRARFSCLGRERAASLVVTESSYGQTRARPAVVDRIAKLCAGADLVVLETAGRLHPAGETNEALAVFATALEEVAERTGACVTLVRHVSKEVARNGQADSYGGRGGGALADAARSVLSVGRRGEHPFDPVILKHTKSTHTARGPDLAWVPEVAGGTIRLRTATDRDLAAAAQGALLDHIREAGQDGVKWRDLRRKADTGKGDRAGKTKDLRAAVDALVGSGAVVSTKEKTGNHGPAAEVLRAAEYAEGL